MSSTAKAEPMAGPGPSTEIPRVKQEMEDVKTEEVKPGISDAEARIMEEIALLPNRYGTAQWELDVSAGRARTLGHTLTGSWKRITSTHIRLQCRSTRRSQPLGSRRLCLRMLRRRGPRRLIGPRR